MYCINVSTVTHKQTMHTNIKKKKKPRSNVACARPYKLILRFLDLVKYTKKK